MTTTSRAVCDNRISMEEVWAGTDKSRSVGDRDDHEKLAKRFEDTWESFGSPAGGLSVHFSRTEIDLIVAALRGPDECSDSELAVAVRHLIDATRTFLNLWNPARDFGGLKEQQWWSVYDQCARVESALAPQRVHASHTPAEPLTSPVHRMQRPWRDPSERENAIRALTAAAHALKSYACGNASAESDT